MPDKQPVCILQIVHGATEYIERYETIAAHFTARGVAVIGHDILGHGDSVAPGGTRMFFSESHGWNNVVADTCYVSKYAQEYISNSVPYCILGFSLGSFIVRNALIEAPDFYDAAILIGTSFVSSAEILFAKKIAIREGKKHGFHTATALIHKLTFDNYNKQFQPHNTDFDWLLSDKNAAEIYEKDPKRGGDFTCGFFCDLLDGMKFTGNKRNIQRMDKHCAIYLISGAQDPVGKCGKGVEKLKKLFHEAGCSNVRLSLYPGRHDILREKCGKEVLNEMIHWMENQRLVSSSD